MALAPPPWFLAARAWPIVSEPGFVSEHEARTARAQVRVSPAATGEYRALGQDSTFAPGSILMETLQRADGRATQILALERRAEDWLYWVLDHRGTPLVAGQPLTCRACHSAAVAAPVFGLPRRE